MPDGTVNVVGSIKDDKLRALSLVHLHPTSHRSNQATALMESRKTPPAALVRSRISPDLIDAPTQRLYLVAFILLLQAIKLAEYAFPTPTDPANELNWSLCKWLALDLFTVQVGGFLAVERMDYGRGWWVVFAALGLSDWLLFGNYTVSNLFPLEEYQEWRGRGWKGGESVLFSSDWLTCLLQFTASVLLPTFLEGMFVRTLTTTERSVRRSTVIGPKDAHLGGQFTVHILAVGYVLPHFLAVLC